MRNSELTPSQRADLDRLAAMSDEDIDTSDIPEIREFSNPRRGVFSGSPNVKAQPISRSEPSGQPDNDRHITDTTERGLETRIVGILTGNAGQPSDTPAVHEHPASYSASWIQSDPTDYDRANCVDLHQLSSFLNATQPEVAAALALETDNPTQPPVPRTPETRESAAAASLTSYAAASTTTSTTSTCSMALPLSGNTTAEERYVQNLFSVTRQLRYSNDEKQRALDLALFINGLPIATFELKNNLTKQTVNDAVQQYRQTRSHS